MTSYIVLRQLEDAHVWEELPGTVEASSSRAAIRDYIRGGKSLPVNVAEVGSGTYAAVPASSWSPTALAVELQVRALTPDDEMPL